MALFKKKAARGNGRTKDFEETLVASEPSLSPSGTSEPDFGAVLTEQPPEAGPAEPAYEEPSETASPEPRSAATGIPAELEPHLRREINRLILVEDNFDRPTKLKAEGSVTSAPRAALSEASWEPKHPATIKEIHGEIDRLKPREARLAGKWLTGFKTSKLLKPRVERVPPNILGKKIVFETEGGFVVEVTYRDGTETRKRYYTASSRKGRARALAEIQSGRLAQIHRVDEERIAGLRRKGGGTLPTPPGKFNTYAITNATDVAAVEGIGDIFARRLHELGIHTTDQLRLMNAQVIANNLGASVGSVKHWQQMSELMIVEGIGKQSAELLVRAGVESIDALRKETFRKLLAKSKQAKKEHKLRGIQAAKARKWIAQARKMRKSPQPFPVVEA